MMPHFLGKCAEAGMIDIGPVKILSQATPYIGFVYFKYHHARIVLIKPGYINGVLVNSARRFPLQFFIREEVFDRFRDGNIVS